MREAERLAGRCHVPADRTALTQVVIDALEAGKSTTHVRSAALALSEHLSALAEAQASALLPDLARATRTSASKVGQEATLRRLVKNLGGSPSVVLSPTDLDDAAGTEAATVLREILTVQELVRTSDTRDRIEAAATRSKRCEASLEKQMQKLSSSVPLVRELGAAIVSFETRRHTNLVWHQANRLERSFPDHTAEDMLGWGWQGLRTALRLYDPSLGFAFSTYACARIVGAIRDGVRAENPVPKRLTTYARKVAAAEERLTQELGRAPSLEEIAERIGSELHQIQIMPRLAPAASVEEITANLGEKGGVPAWSISDSDPAQAAVDAERRAAIGAALRLLPAEEAEAVRLLVMEQRPPAEARQLTGATTRQLRQRSRRGLATLREYLADLED